MTFNEKAFNVLFAPRWGKIRARVMVGGAPWEDAVVDSSTKLKLSH